MSATKLEPTHSELQEQIHNREQVFDAFRRWGYLQAQLDPLGQYLPAEPLPELDLEGEDAEEARSYYCGTHCGRIHAHSRAASAVSGSRSAWKAEAPVLDQKRILERLIQADVFEQVIQSRYLGTKRFSLEGVTALIPFLDEMLNRAQRTGRRKSRDRHEPSRAPERDGEYRRQIACRIFSKFEDVDPRSILGGGDVKYHVGATGDYQTRNGKTCRLHLVSNPSHLEAVDPVAMGRARAKQTRYGEDGQDRVLPVVIHGDAAFAGQGIWAETMNLGIGRRLHRRWHHPDHRQQPDRIYRRTE